MTSPEKPAPVPCHDFITQRLADLRKIHTPEGIEALEPVEIGGVTQWISIRGRNRHNPILLFIHGGPASPVMGRYDLHTSYTSARDYFDRIRAPFKKFITFERSAHFPMVEEPGRVLMTLVNKFYHWPTSQCNLNDWRTRRSDRLREENYGASATINHRITG